MDGEGRLLEGILLMDKNHIFRLEEQNRKSDLEYRMKKLKHERSNKMINLVIKTTVIMANSFLLAEDLEDH